MRESTPSARKSSVLRVAFIPFYFAPDVSAISQLFTPFVYELAKRTGHEVTVFTSRSRYIRSVSADEHTRSNLIRFERVPTLNFGKHNILTRLLDYAVYYAHVAFRFLVSRRYDVVLSLTQPPMMPAFLGTVLRYRSTPFIYYVEDLYPEILFDVGIIRSPWLVRKLRRFNDIAFHRAQAVVTIGAYMARYLEASYGVPERKITVIHNWPNVEAPNDSELSSDALRLVYSGNLGLAHDLMLLPELLRRLATHRQKIVVVFYGGGRREREVRKLLTNLPNSVTAEFHGYAPMDQVASNLSRADVLLLAQSAETVVDIIPSKFYSYLAVGRPLLFFGPVDSDIGQNIVNAGLGWVLDRADDIPLIARGLSQLGSESPLSLAIGKRARRLASNRFSMDRAVDTIAGKIKELTRVP